MYRILFFAFFLSPFILGAQSKTKIISPEQTKDEVLLKKVDAVSFLKEILGATYSKADKSWVLPRNKQNADLFSNDAEGGLFVAVDTIIKRTVSENEEQWVLFIVEGYIFNFASLVKTSGGWMLKKMQYSLHKGAPGEYQPLDFNFKMIGQKTFISVKEQWFSGSELRSKWLLFDPLSLKNAVTVITDVEPASDDLPEAYKYHLTTQTKFKPGESILPDIVFTQEQREKVKGKKETVKELSVRYIWNDKKGVFEKEKKVSNL